MAGFGYLDELVEERRTLDPSRYSHAMHLLEGEILRVRGGDGGRAGGREGGRVPEREPLREPVPEAPKIKEDMVKVTEKVMLPATEFPKFNFVGRLLGPKGSIMRGIAETTKTKISILGQGSTRDKEKEEELAQSDDPKHAHFKEPLHVFIQVEAPKSEGHLRIADALEEIKNALLPDPDMGHEGDMGPRRGMGGRPGPFPQKRGFEGSRAGGSQENDRYGGFNDTRNTPNGGYAPKRMKDDYFDEPRGRDAYYDDVARY